MILEKRVINCIMVEAAVVEPTSENIPLRGLQTLAVD